MSPCLSLKINHFFACARIRNFWRVFFFFLGVFALPLQGETKEVACPGFFYGHQPPESNLSVNIICERHFALGYSEDRTSSLWSAEHLTRTGLLHAGQLPPDRARFYPDERVPVTSRAQIEDYRQVNLIPAPLVPHEDMPDITSRIESYALTNAIPEDPRFHALSWKKIEDDFRKEAIQNEEAYIITGVGYMAALNALGWDQIHVPTHVWKAIYLPRQKKGKAIACRNQIPAGCHWIDWDELTNVTGINPFPAFSSTEEKEQAVKDEERDLQAAEEAKAQDAKEAMQQLVAKP
ncbi:DNA/RNA non-specific endonuclease [Acetobacteraceae bacterium]|nr:DNA/RNA non-specific endonuclease [Acetobacteraceae bacterium]